MKIISDKALVKIQVKDNGERLVDIKSVSPGVIINIDPKSQKIEDLVIYFKYKECTTSHVVQKKKAERV